MVEARRTSIPGVIKLLPKPIRDERGFFVRVLDREDYIAADIDPAQFLQENQSRSSYGTLRGMHFRTHGGEAKLMRCSSGRVQQVIVDLRPHSPSFKVNETHILDDLDHQQIYVPRGCAVGFQVLSEIADIQYRHDAVYAPELEAAFRYDDAEIGIAWPLEDPLLSERDITAPAFSEIEPQLDEWFGDLTL